MTKDIKEEMLEKSGKIAAKILETLNGENIEYVLSGLSVAVKYVVHDYIQRNKDDPENCKEFKKRTLHVFTTFIENEKI